MRQAGRKPGQSMSPLTQFDQEMDKIIREIALRIVPPILGDFDTVWETANRVCDAYEIPGRELPH